MAGDGATVIETIATKELQVGSGANIKEISAEANGTEAVTISNVAPSGVGTATISAWLKVNVSGAEYFLPMWT